MEESVSQEAQVTTEGSTETTSEATVVDQSTGETVSETSYANGKYKSVSDLENGYAELQKSYSQKLGGFDGAPEEYTLSEGIEDSELIGIVKQWGKDNQLNNDGLNSLVESYENYRTEQHNMQVENEMKALGENADARLGNIRDFVSANLGEEALGAFGSVLNSAKAIEAVEQLISMTKSAAPAETPAQTKQVDSDQLRAMRFAKDENGNRRMSIDPAYRAKVMEIEAQMKGGNSSYVVNQ